MNSHAKKHAPEDQAKAGPTGEDKTPPVNGAEPQPQPGDGIPTTEQIQAAVEGNQRVVTAAATMSFISGQVQQMVTAMCGGNTRLALAVVSENKLFYEEVLRRSIEINVKPRAEEKASATDEQDNTAEKK